MALLSGLTLVATLCLGAGEPAGHRVALVVGANGAAPGRAKLRFAHQDAEAMAAALREVGEFAPADVEVLLDPDPQELLRRMDARLASVSGSDGLFLFYYSGHADERALYPRGKPLPLASLRDRLDRAPPGVRIGIIDACRGGGWTQAKGFTAETPFEVEVPLDATAEGSVLISSSSGLESAHESEALEGSFFTHYLIAGMRGAAAQSRPGTVSLVEAFSYAQQHTVRDTAFKTGSPQHPSFHINLQGRSDLLLARLDDSPSALAVHETHGPLQLIQTSSGVELLELTEGERDVRLAVPPGDYILRKIDGGRIFARELEVKAGQTAAIDEASLQLTGREILASKSEPQGRPTWTASLTEGLVAGSTAVGGGVVGRIYLTPLADDPTRALDPDGLEQAQHRGVVELGAATLHLDGQELWEGGLDARLYPWRNTGFGALVQIAEGQNRALEVAFGLGVSQYLGRNLRVELGYLGERSLNGAPSLIGNSVLIEQSQFDGAALSLQHLSFHGRLRLNLDLTAGATESAWASVGTCSGAQATLDGSARWQLTRAFAARLEGGVFASTCSVAGNTRSLLGPQGGAGVTYAFTDAISADLTVLGGYSTVFDFIELPPGVSGVLSLTERF
jgi:hypothetical protein